MKTTKYLTITLFASVFSCAAMAQQNTVATGGDATGSGGTVSYTLGQIDYSSQTGTNGSVSQGVQQPLTIGTNSITENENEFSVLLYPNPTIAELHIEFKEDSKEAFSCVLVDATGKQVLNELVESKELTINLIDLSRGNYFLNFMQEGEIIGSYQVVKN